jgi:hypothetical protein
LLLTLLAQRQPTARTFRLCRRQPRCAVRTLSGSVWWLGSSSSHFGRSCLAQERLRTMRKRPDSMSGRIEKPKCPAWPFRTAKVRSRSGTSPADASSLAEVVCIEATSLRPPPQLTMRCDGTIAALLDCVFEYSRDRHNWLGPGGVRHRRSPPRLRILFRTRCRSADGFRRRCRQAFP